MTRDSSRKKNIRALMRELNIPYLEASRLVDELGARMIDLNAAQVAPITGVADVSGQPTFLDPALLGQCPPVVGGVGQSKGARDMFDPYLIIESSPSAAAMAQRVTEYLLAGAMVERAHRSVADSGRYVRRRPR